MKSPSFNHSVVKSLRRFAVVAMAVATAFLPASLWAQNPGEDYVVGASQKLGRGLVNMASSLLEIPCAVQEDLKERGGAGLATGFFRGLPLMLRRLLVGATEAMTFVIPMPETLPPVCSKRPEAQVEAT